MRAAEVLDINVELQPAGADPRQRYPGVAVHFAACEGCREDFAGLLAAVRSGDP